MAKVMDITDKLSFDSNPKLKIGKKEIEVNADAPTVLKIMGLMSEEGDSTEKLVEACELLFPEESRAALDELKLSFHDFVIVIQLAVELVTGEASQGE